MSVPSSARSALLIVDMQVGLFHGPDRPHDGQRVLDNLNELIQRAEAAGAPIVAIRHNGPAGSPIEPGSPLTQLLPELAVDPARDLVLDKTRASSFLGTNLEPILREMGVDRLVIGGMKTQYCVDTACRAAAERGFQPILVADGHTCMDTPDLSAPAIIAHHNRTLNGPFARVLASHDIVF